MFYHHHPIKDLLKVCHGVTGDPKRRGLPPNKKGSLPRKRRCVKSNKVWSRLKMFNFAADKFPLDYFPILANLFLILANYLSIFHCHLCQRHIGNWSIGIRNREIVAYMRANKCPNFESNKVTSALMQLLVSCRVYFV